MRRIFLIPILFIISYISYAQLISNLSINEIYQKDGETWIELYNAADQPVLLEHIFLSDDDANYKKWKVMGAESIAPGEFIIVKFDSVSTTGVYVKGAMISGERLYLHHVDKGSLNFLDAVYIGKMTRISLCKFPDGRDKEFRTNRATPGTPNEIRDLIRFRVTPVIGAGISSAKFRQTISEYETRPGVYKTLGLMSDFYVLERYKMIVGINFSRFLYGMKSDDVVSYNDKVEVRKKMTGRENSRWIDITIPLVYNSVRVHRNVFVDFGFLVSIRSQENLSYDQTLTYYDKVTGERLGTPKHIDYNSDSEFDNDVLIRAPLKIGVSYAPTDHWEFSVHYLNRNDPDNPGIGDAKRNLKYALYTGVSYNINIFKIRTL